MYLSLSWAGEKTSGDTRTQLVARHSTEDPKDDKKINTINTPKDTGSESRALPVYKPPKRGAPGGRVGGATRGDREANLNVEVLAPDKVRGLTSRAQPDLYWYLSKPTTVPIEFTLIDEEAVEPLLEIRLPQPSTGGLQRIRLSDYGIHLKDDKMYRWSIALVMDGEHRSKDIMAGARIQLALPSEIPTDHLAGADPFHATFIHAEAGLWYDAIASVSEAIQSDPEQEQYRDMRAGLLEQVGLEVVANADRKKVAGF